ncbi:TetR family transcriptional regulator [Microbacterium sp. M1A1_1b]
MNPTNDRPTGRPRTIDPDAVSLIALRLFDDDGFDAVSMDDVAAAAGISRRSLFRLFPSKAALVWGGLDEFALRFTDALQRRPAAESSGVALRAAYLAAASFDDDALEVTRHRLRVIRANPSLERGGEATVTSLTDTIVRFVAEREGRPTDDLAVTVRAHAVAAAASAALTWWALHDDGSRPAQAMERAFDVLAIG